MSVRTRSSTRLQALHFSGAESPTRINPEDQEFTNLTVNRTEKEDEIWEEVREEQYEVLEQLPLTLHRQLILLRQLDQKAHDYSSELLPMIQRYISLRKILASNDQSLNPGDRASSTMFDAVSEPRQANSEARGSPLPSSEETGTTRETLSAIACVSDQYLQMSREKVNLAQTAHDLVDRHIRLLDQFIKEQEASLSSETTAPLSLTLSDLVVPKWSRSARVSMSPMLEEEDHVPPNALNAPPPVEEGAAMDRSSKKRPTKGRGRQKDREEQGGAGLKITLPPTQFVNAPSELPIDPNEPTWCYCNRVSFGEMIGCDNPGCKYEWFHLECVGLTEVPEDDEWYCRDCILHREVKSRRK